MKLLRELAQPFRDLARWPWIKKPQLQVELTPEQILEARRQKFNNSVRQAISLAYSELHATGKPVRPNFPLEPYTPLVGVCPKEFERGLALDAAWKNLTNDASFTLSNLTSVTATVLDGLGFPGFPYLIELTQLTEYRDMSERTAAEMTRKWIELRSTGTVDKTETLSKLNAALERHHIRDLFQKGAMLDGQMGRAQLFVSFGDVTGPELETPLMLNKYKIKKGSLRGFKIIEPITTYPAQYNGSNPLASDYYQPSAWFVYGQKVHASRLLLFESRPLPDLLKPVYNFSGISLSQLAQPYVDYWLGARDSVGKLLKNFSITVLHTDLDVLLNKSGEELIRRIQLFTTTRDNQGVFLVNKEQEDLTQLNTPLSGLDKLLAQAQEHMAAVAKTPLVILLGVTPTGLNASTEGEIRVYYDYIADQQEKLFRKNLETVLKIIMLDELGYVDEDITFDFLNLYSTTEKDQAVINKSNSDRDVALIQAGVLSPEEVRTEMATDPKSGYNNLDVSSVPVAPESTGGEIGGSVTTEEPGLTETPTNSEAADIALDIMKSASVLVGDGGFRGNQHIGGISDKDDPLGIAMKLTAAATAASRKARRLGTRTAHTQAHKAHSRALEAHNRALSSAGPHEHVHRAYADAHKAARQVHGAVGGEA